MNCKRVKELLDLYIEKELSPEITGQVTEHLKGCPSCQEELRSWNKVYARMGRVVSAPEGFTQSVMRRLTAQPEPEESKRFFDFVLQPGVLHWRLAGVGAVAIFLLLLLPPLLRRERVPVFQEDTRLITFTFAMPGAQTVSLVGDFNGWEPANLQLNGPDVDGVWTITVPIRPGRYQYGFIVDGQWMTDPKAQRHADDGFGGKNAIIKI